jgi:N-acetylmuramoyl-L-alanine amidase
MSAPLIAICVGHSRLIKGKIEGGAVAVDGTNEWKFNCVLAGYVCSDLGRLGITSVCITRYEGDGYSAAQRWLASELRRIGAAAALELHFNDSDNPKANGHEMLYWQTSARGKALAASIDAQFDRYIPEIADRNLLARTDKNRGADFLGKTHCPAVIVESFFGSNADDWQDAKIYLLTIAKVIAFGIRDWLAADSRR